jgi:hypothetical protein
MISIPYLEHGSTSSVHTSKKTPSHNAIEGGVQLIEVGPIEYAYNFECQKKLAAHNCVKVAV